MEEKRQRKCNYEEVHALYKTTKKVPASADPVDVKPKEKIVPAHRFMKDNFLISRPTVPMVEQFYEK